MLKGNTLRELTSTEFTWMRMKRHEGRKTPITHVVWVELTNGNLVELEAHGAYHAISLIEHWLENGDSITASYRTVKKDGTLGKCIRIFDNFKNYLEDDFFEEEYA
jgi:hypothetical protein